MRSAFGSWLIERRIARVALIAALLPLFGIVSAAIVVCASMARGWREGLVDCLIALAVLLGLTSLSGGGVPQVLFSGVSTWSVALLMGGLTGAYGSLTLAIQAIVMLGCMAILGFAVIVGDPAEFWGPILQTFAAQMQGFGIELSDSNAIMDLVPIMIGLFAAGTLASSIVALLLGCWWAGGARGVDFRELFLGLRLGYIIGAVAAIAGVGSLLGMQPLAGNLLLVAGTGFLFQGLAVVHWHAARRRLPWFMLIPVYVPLFMGSSLFVMALMLFATLGFIDNWYGLRRAKQV